MYSYVPFQVIGVTITASCLIEFLSWLLIYRNSKFKGLAIEGDVLQTKLDELKAAGKDNEKDKNYKKVSNAQTILTYRLSVYKMGTMAIQAAIMMSTWRIVSKMFGGQVVGTLPFHPPAFIARITHMGLEGTDMTQCSSHAIYVLSQMALRGITAKLFNVEAARVLAKHGQSKMMEKLTKQE